MVVVGNAGHVSLNLMVFHQKSVDPSRHITAAALENTYRLTSDKSKFIEDSDQKKVERTTAIVRFPFGNMIMSIEDRVA